MKKLNWIGLIMAIVLCLAMLPAGVFAEGATAQRSVTVVPETDLPANDELFAGYVERELYRSLYGDVAPFGTLARDRLANDSQKALYDVLKKLVEDLAAGRVSSTQFEITNWADLGVTKTKYTVAELGVSSIINSDNSDITDAAYTKLYELVWTNVFGDGAVAKALLHDCPYDMYWYDKTKGMALGFGYSWGGKGTSSEYVQLMGLMGYFTPANAYAAGEMAVDTSAAAATATAAANAQAIVARHASKSDADKLRAYMEEICNLVSYNSAAAGNSSTPYGDPWQLIYVFDGNTSTEVVCEGYAKAFQYLCDLSTFSGDVTCYSVTGVMRGGTGAGRHMWNIVQMDGVNYLVDVTNCDSGTVGAPDQLFMLSEATGTWNDQYTVKPNGSSIIYKYDADVISLWGQDVLELGGEAPHTHNFTVEVSGTRVPATCKDTGSVTMKCASCTQTQQQTLAIDPENHVGGTEIRNAKAVTCEEDGYTGDTYCLGCNAKTASGEVITAVGAHNFTVEVEGTKVAATCKDEGSVTMKCSACSQTLAKSLPVDPENHIGETYTAGYVAPDCGSEGYTGDIKCVGCNALLESGSVIAATEAHNYTIPVETSRVHSTCKTHGSINMKCSICDAMLPTELPLDPDNHEGSTETRDAKAATCGDDGYTGDTYCLGCNAKTATGTTIAASGEHNFSIEVDGSKVAATCKDEGHVTMKCFVCNETEEQTLPVDPENHTGETYTTGYVAPDCDSEGYTGDIKCVGCNALLESGSVIAATEAHNYTMPVETSRKPSTCKTHGSIKMKCSDCQAMLPTELPLDPNNHEGGTETRDAKAATCGEDGYTGDNYCLGCNAKTAIGTTIPATAEHNFTVEVAGTKVAATCKAEGSVTMKCSVCNETEEQTLPVDADNHVAETYVDGYVAPDCGSEGYTGDTKCAGCDAVKVTGTIIPSTGEHSFTVEVAGSKVAATCKAEGSVTMKCSGCNETEEQTLPIDADNHAGETYVEGYVAPTCGSEGYTGDTKCSDCNAVTATGSTIPATAEHNFTVEVEGTKVAATCKVEGSVTVKCSACEETEEQTLPIDSTNHAGETYVDGYWAPDCANDGYTGDTYCFDCYSPIKSGDIIPATGEHSFTVEVEGSKVAATCKAEGSVTMKCSGCEETEEQPLPIDADNHAGETYVDGYVAPTCGSEGYTGDTKCSDCNAVTATGSTIPATAEHNFTVEVAGSKVAATCKAEGSVTMKCSGCEETEEQTLPVDADNHVEETYVDGYVAADCGNDGYTGDTKCAGCDAVKVTGTIIPSTGEHSFTVEVEGTKVAATCKAEGSATMKCSGCNETEEQTLPIDADNHVEETYVDGYVAADCGNDGYTGDAKCAGCDAVKVTGTIIPSTGEHSFTVEVAGTKVAATCKAEGSVTMQCSGCNETEEQTLPIDADNHAGETYVDGYVAPTCGSEGYTGDTKCSDCNAVTATGSTIPATAEHNFTVEVAGTKVAATCKDEGSVTMKCSACEETEEQTLPVDADNHVEETYVDGYVAPSCSNEGYTGDTKCAGCDAVVENGSAIPANGEHTDADDNGLCDDCDDSLSTAAVINCGEGGAVTVAGGASAVGETVVLNVVPEDGYEVASVTAKDANGETVAVSKNSDGQYVFTQPAGKVTVTVTFHKVQVAKYTLTVVCGTGSGEYAAGETVTIKADTRDGFVFKGWLYNVSLDFVTGSASSSEASFVMPAENVTIEASYESIISYLTYTVTYDANGGIGVMSAQSTMIGMPVTLQGCAFVAPEGMRFKGWSLSPDGGELIEKVTSFTDVTVYAIWETVPVVTPPVTGDDAAIGLWLMLMLVSGAGAVYLVRRRKAN